MSAADKRKHGDISSVSSLDTSHESQVGNEKDKKLTKKQLKKMAKTEQKEGEMKLKIVKGI